eukprot:GFYU01002249.1.p1 GENE.GFYU01002249.1~~GFYU01002249.1.p1  ORF type:complete len:267 (-),score=100.14 GFYU01002249.1:225-1025(-)
MAIDAQLMSKYKELKQLFDSNSDPQKCLALLNQLKIDLFAFLTPVATPTAAQKEEFTVARDVLEMATMLSVRTADMGGLERHFAQLKPFYYDFSTFLDASPRHWSILGLNLMRLLAQNLIAEFHTELELIPLDQFANPYIQFPVELEREIMEGSYHKLVKTTKSLPDPSYSTFMDTLLSTVRNDVAECSAAAYESLDKQSAQSLFMFSNEKDLAAFIADNGWEMKGSRVYFNADMDVKDSGSKLQIPSLNVIKETLSYAKELERIV